MASAPHRRAQTILAARARTKVRHIKEHHAGEHSIYSNERQTLASTCSADDVRRHDTSFLDFLMPVGKCNGDMHVLRGIIFEYASITCIYHAAAHLSSARTPSAYQLFANVYRCYPDLRSPDWSSDHVEVISAVMTRGFSPDMVSAAMDSVNVMWHVTRLPHMLLAGGSPYVSYRKVVHAGVAPVKRVVNDNSVASGIEWGVKQFEDGIWDKKINSRRRDRALLHLFSGAMVEYPNDSMAGVLRRVNLNATIVMRTLVSLNCVDTLQLFMVHCDFNDSMMTESIRKRITASHKEMRYAEVKHKRSHNRAEGHRMCELALLATGAQVKKCACCDTNRYRCANRGSRDCNCLSCVAALDDDDDGGETFVPRIFAPRGEPVAVRIKVLIKLFDAARSPSVLGQSEQLEETLEQARSHGLAAVSSLNSQMHLLIVVFHDVTRASESTMARRRAFWTGNVMLRRVCEYFARVRGCDIKPCDTCRHACNHATASTDVFTFLFALGALGTAVDRGLLTSMDIMSQCDLDTFEKLADSCVDPPGIAVLRRLLAAGALAGEVTFDELREIMPRRVREQYHAEFVEMCGALRPAKTGGVLARRAEARRAKAAALAEAEKRARKQAAARRAEAEAALHANARATSRCVVV